MIEPDASAPSKSARKRRAQAYQDLAERLTRLEPDRLAELALTPELATAIAEGRRIRAFGARKRQIKYIGRLLREGEGPSVEAALAAQEAQHRRRVEHDRRVVALRDRLLGGFDGEEGALQDIGETERAALVALIERARAERAAGVDRGGARALLRHLRQLLPGP
jgi:ribosome-associated protein